MRHAPPSLAAGVATVALLAGCVRMAPAGDPLPGRVVDQAVADDCRRVGAFAGIDTRHVEPSVAPPAEELYDRVPPTGGRHFGQVHPLVVDATQPADVRATTHNLEHGAVVVHVDASRLAVPTRVVETWARQLAAAGFAAPDVGAGVLVVAMPEDATDDPVVALRAWGTGLDCDAWDRGTADAFVVANYGERGAAPERDLAPYPEDNGVLLDPGAFV